MLHVVRRSEIIGWVAIDSATASHLGHVEEVWLDQSGRIAYLSSNGVYRPIEQVASMGLGAVTLYHAGEAIEPGDLHRLHQFVLQSPLGESLGWVQDFLFNWQTGEIAAYIITGEIAAPFGGQAVLYPEDVEAIISETLVIPEAAQHRLKTVPDGLQGFLSEKSQQVKQMVHLLSDRLHHLISPQDKPDVVHVKIKTASQELAMANNHDHSAMQEATEFLHQQWEHLKHSVSRTGDRARTALDTTWKQLTGKR